MTTFSPRIPLASCSPVKEAMAMVTSRSSLISCGRIRKASTAHQGQTALLFVTLFHQGGTYYTSSNQVSEAIDAISATAGLHTYCGRIVDRAKAAAEARLVSPHVQHDVDVAVRVLDSVGQRPQLPAQPLDAGRVTLQQVFHLHRRLELLICNVALAALVAAFRRRRRRRTQVFHRKGLPPRQRAAKVFLPVDCRDGEGERGDDTCGQSKKQKIS